MATDAQCIELLEGQEFGSSLRSGDFAVRQFIVIPNDDTTNYGTQDQAKNHPSVPRKSNAHPRRSDLLAQDIRSVYVPESKQCSLITVTYTASQGMIWPLEKPRRRWSLGNRSIEVLVDLNGRAIGSPVFTRVESILRDSNGNPILNPVFGDYQYVTETDTGGAVNRRKSDSDAQLGKSVLVPELTLSIQMPMTYDFDLGLCLQLRMCVNSLPFEGMPAGTVQYLGSNADQLGINGEYFVTHEFRCGQVTYRDRASGSTQTVYLDQDFFYLFKDREGAGRMLEDDQARIADTNRYIGNTTGTINQNPTTVVLYPRGDLNLLVPT